MLRIKRFFDFESNIYLQETLPSFNILIEWNDYSCVEQIELRFAHEALPRYDDDRAEEDKFIWMDTSTCAEGDPELACRS